MDLSQLLTLVVVVAGVPLTLAAYIVGTEYLVRVLPDGIQGKVRPWIWVGPALVFIGLFLVYPTIDTIRISFLSRSGAFIGLDNYSHVLSDSSVLIAIRNNVLWLVLYTGLALFFGILLAVLADRVPYESSVKSLIFMPMAISFTATAVIWKFMFLYQPAGAVQTGTLNYIVTAFFHAQPAAWVVDRRFNNFALIAAAVWGWVGFSMVILSAALKGIPGELLEAARVDGAGELTIFRRVVMPLLMPTVAVVATTLLIFALKAFDIVYVMTNGNFDTDVLALRQYKELFTNGNPGRSGALAMILLLAVVPVLVFNLRQFRATEGRR